MHVGVGHLITVIIGAGVLSLPKAFSLLGWLFGPVLLIFFGVVSLWTSNMLSMVYEVDGKKNRTVSTHASNYCTSK
jgi:amino acid permease